MISEKIIVVGGGVAGLSAAIGVARQGFKVRVLEQEHEFGARIKGEVINKSAEIFKEIFGKDGIPTSMDRIVYKSAKYYTPSTKKHATRVLPGGIKIGIEYRELVDELVRIAIAEGVVLALNAKAVDFIEADQKIIGVRYQQFGQIKEVTPKFIICATGFHSKLAIPTSIKPPQYVNPAIKIVAEGLKIPDPHELEFFLLDIPAIIWIFPKPRNRAELGITIWTTLLKDKSTIKLYDLLLEKAKTHPILKERLSQGTYIYVQPERLPFGGPVRKTFFPNIYFIGDMMGHVGAVGGSGIVSSMTIGYKLGALLGKTLKEKGSLELEDFQEAQKMINKSEIGKWLKKEQSSAKAMREILYNPPKTPAEIDAIWGKFKGFIEGRGA